MLRFQIYDCSHNAGILSDRGLDDELIPPNMIQKYFFGLLKSFGKANQLQNEFMKVSEKNHLHSK